MPATKSKNPKPPKSKRRNPFSNSPTGAERKPTKMGDIKGRMTPPGPAKLRRKDSTWKQWEDYSYRTPKPKPAKRKSK